MPSAARWSPSPLPSCRASPTRRSVASQGPTPSPDTGSFAGREVRDVADPHLIERHAVHVERSRQPIRRDRIAVLRVRRDDTSTRAWACGQARFAHQARAAFGARRQPSRAQLLVHARRAVRFPAAGEGDPHVLATTPKIEPACLPNARPIAVNVSPALNRRHSSTFCTSLRPGRPRRPIVMLH